MSDEQMTVKQFRKLNWKQVYAYQSDPRKPGSKGFKTFGCDLEGLSVTHEIVGSRVIRISYRVHKRTTDSPSQAVKWWNAAIRLKQRGGSEVPGSPQSLGRSKAAVRGRGNERPGLQAQPHRGVRRNVQPETA